MNEETLKREFPLIVGTPENGKSANGTPQFPGQQKGWSIEQVRELIRKQKRVKGFRLAIPNGQSTHNIQLSGTARIFLGFAFAYDGSNGNPAGTPEASSLKINEETVIENVRPFFFTNYLMDDEYYFIPRPLSGTDQISFTFNNAGAAQNWDLCVYYIGL